jgi:hypothetical protein
MESLSDDILLNIFRKAVISDGEIVQGHGSMAFLPLVCRRFKDLIASSKFFCWTIDSGISALTYCLSGRTDCCFDTMVVDARCGEASIFERQIDSLSALLLLAKSSLTYLSLDGMRLLSCEETVTQEKTDSRWETLLRYLQKCLNLRLLFIGLEDSAQIPPCILHGVFQSLKELSVVRGYVVLRTEAFDQQFPSLEALELDGQLGGTLKASKLVKLKLNNECNLRAISIIVEAPNLRELSVDVSGADPAARCTLDCPELQRLIFTGHRGQQGGRVQLNMVDTGPRQHLALLGVWGIYEESVVSTVAQFQGVDVLTGDRVGALVGKLPCRVKEFRFREEQDWYVRVASSGDWVG